MKAFPIWSEGYACTGQSAGAHFHGWSNGDDFRDACITYAADHPEFNDYYNPETNTYWGCSLFQDEYMARRSFG